MPRRPRHADGAGAAVLGAQRRAPASTGWPVASASPRSWFAAIAGAVLSPYSVADGVGFAGFGLLAVRVGVALRPRLVSNHPSRRRRRAPTLGDPDVRAHLPRPSPSASGSA
ncbi:MAG: hypothetical protein V9G12_24865 [Microthrixaceae bacterium]